MAWRDLVSGKSDPGELAIGCVTVPYASSSVTKAEAVKEVEAHAAAGEPVEMETRGEGFLEFKKKCEKKYFQIVIIFRGCCGDGDTR